MTKFGPSRFSILILTFNEASNIPGCLESVAWADDVVVLDSFSTDETVKIARSRGVRVIQRRFDNFGDHRNWAHDNIEFKYEWVFHLDADERFTEALRRECEKVVAEDRHSAYFVANRMMFLGRWIRHASQYPYHQVRLVKPSEMRFTNLGHGQMESEMKRGAGYLKEPYVHYNFSKGISDWVRRHNQYSEVEAEHILSEEMTNEFRVKDLFAREQIRRRRAMKILGGRLPGKPLIKFLYLYFFCLGFLDGLPGFYYCLLQAFYQLMIDIKVRERRLQGAGKEM